MASAQFTGDGETTVYTLNDYPVSVSSVTVADTAATFSWSGNVITLTAAPDDGATVTVSYVSKLEVLRTLCGQNETAAPDSVLEVYLKLAEDAVIHKRYPYLVDFSSVVVPDQFAVLQCEIANEMFQKRGAEGETGHSENGVNRSYETAGVSSSLLKRILPCARVVTVTGETT